jgi:hypothetical protein
MSVSPPRFSPRAIKYLEDFDVRPEEMPLGLKLEDGLCCGSGDELKTYDGPHLQPYGHGGTYSASCTDPITVSVGNRSFVMSAADIQATGGRYVELLPVQAMSGLSFMYVLAIV